MGEVWLARQEGLAGGRPVAVKRMLSHLAYDTRASQMFLDEARIASQLSHPNVVQIFDVGREDETYYLVMEFVFGENCARILERARKRKIPIPTVLAARICAEAAKGLHHAHTRTGPGGRPLGIIHRDVTPPNIMVTDEGEVKVLDFGIAKAVDRVARTEAGNVKGKVEYLAPEQIEGSTIDHRADQFSLGAVLFELCTGKKLFARETLVATLAAVSECKVPPPSRVSPSVDPRIDEIVLRATQKRPADRYPSLQEMREALVEVMRGRESRAGSAELSQFVSDLFRDEQAERRQFLDRIYQQGQVPDAAAVRRAESLAVRADPLAKAIDRALDEGPPVARTFEGGSEEPTLVSPVHKKSKPAPVVTTPIAVMTPEATPLVSLEPAPLTRPRAPDDEATDDRTPAVRASFDAGPSFSIDSVSLPEDGPQLPEPRPQGARSMLLVGGGLLSLAVAGAIVGGTLFYRHSKAQQSSAPETGASAAAAEAPDAGLLVAPEIRLGGEPDAAAAPPDAGVRVAPRPAEPAKEPVAKVRRRPPPVTSSTRATAAADEPIKQKKRRGTLSVTVTGDGSALQAGVYLDGEWVGLSPVDIRASTGPHLLEVRQDGWQTQRRGVQIEPGKPGSLEVDLVREARARPQPEKPPEAEEPPPEIDESDDVEIEVAP